MLTRSVITLFLIFTSFLSYTNSELLEYDMDIVTTSYENNNHSIFLEYLDFDVARLTQTLFVIDGNIGIPYQRFKFTLDTSSYATWVAEISAREGDFGLKQKYIPYKSKYYSSEGQEKYLKYPEYTIRGYELYDVISLSRSMPSKPMKFVGATAGRIRNSRDFDGSIGLGRVYNDDSQPSEFSFIKYLLDQGLITKQVFSFQSLSNKNEGKFYIGEYHSDFKKDYAKCEVPTGTSTVWGCMLSHVFAGELTKKTFDDGALPVDMGVIITTGTEGIIAPMSLWDYFEHNYFKKFLDSKQCEKVSGPGKIAVTCDKYFPVYDLPPLYIVVNGYGLKLSPVNLFIRGRPGFEDKNICVIIFNDNYSYLLMGQPLFYDNHILFDQEKNLIAFYGDYKEISKLEDEGKGKDDDKDKKDDDKHKDEDKDKDGGKDKKDGDKDKDGDKHNDADQASSSGKGLGIGWVLFIVIIIVIVVAGIGLIIFCINRKHRLAAQQMSSHSNLI
jgi:hypothetical protein